VQAWSSPAALKKCVQSEPSPTSTSTLTLPAAPTLKADPNQPSVLWNAMIVPFLKYKIRSVLWYQGEANVGNGPYYQCAFKAMIEDWQSTWDLKKLTFSFLFVQLAAYTEGNPGVQLALLRQAQLEVMKQVPYVGMATAVDLGDLGSPYGNIHPRDKQDVGTRLSLAAQHFSYGDKNIIYSGPIASSFRTVSNTQTLVVSVTFDAYSLGSGLKLVSSSCPLPASNCAWFELQSSTGAWFNATSYSVAGGMLTLQVVNWQSGRDCTGARYGYNEWPVCVLYNVEGLPAPPFILP